MIQIRPQFYLFKGYRPLTYGLWVNGVFVGYSRCWCAANKAAEWLSLTLRNGASEREG